MEVLFVGYYELGKIKVNMKFKKMVNEEIDEAVKKITRIDFHPISDYKRLAPEEYKKYKPAGKADVYWLPPDSYEADIYLPPTIKKWENMYIFIHEIGHAVNKHAGLSLDIDIRENEADMYAMRRMEQWLSKVEKEGDKNEIKKIIAIVKMRIKDRISYKNSRLSSKDDHFF